MITDDGMESVAVSRFISNSLFTLEEDSVRERHLRLYDLRIVFIVTQSLYFAEIFTIFPAKDCMAFLVVNDEENKDPFHILSFSSKKRSTVMRGAKIVHYLNISNNQLVFDSLQTDKTDSHLGENESCIA